ncbi:tannase/feruloyl esterase family alpha/beta hydrolase [Telluria mixta]|uniref:Tannase/feruloyl esterase family alpha/beta hydrolase n=1 Tax=Telluria mixta TaxID=34071 RepID=A0ABT2C163_9BURK|nr:tannase/feruloyl esterase family alpha/beta hydrolase [Telluria mixta]MCS0631117.1 tannase/feruloyl esterase family alpha/beta hydrolase [Telluria mixta]WEM95658.1 tannase/feruloyl esterase family alpha/beta hydrolase [Telluria mixta]
MMKAFHPLQGLLAITVLLAGCHGGAAVAPADTTAAALAVVKPVADCTQLAAVDVTDIGGAGSKINSATVVATTVNGSSVSLCVVKGTLAPSNTFEVALPVGTWTQRFAALGCGGLCGNVADPTKEDAISFSYKCPLVQQGGFVTAATDMGHQGFDPGWTADAQKQADFAYRGQHITTLAAKKLIKAYYGQEQKFSYFVGCSDGGREALMAAQRYPNDYNGIVAGAPAAHFQLQNSVFHGWSVVANSTTGDSSGNSILYPDKVAVLHKAVLAACADTPDGLISDPRACRFDPASIACPAGAQDTSQCLTQAEVLAAGRIYGGPADAKTGAPMQAGRPVFGSEGNWVGVEVPTSGSSSAPVPVKSGVFSYNIVTGAYNLIFTGTPARPDIDTFGYTDSSFYATYLAENHPLNDATNPDLSAFRKAGGKLILWHGWADQHISPLYTIQYYEAMQGQMGQATVDEFARLYLVPGVAHCGGGEGNDNIDLVSGITGWVEQGTAPGSVMTYKLDSAGAQTASRPVYPYPAVAQYTGSGDWHDGANYASGAPRYNVRTPSWPGSIFYTPYAPKVQGVPAP